MATPLTDQAIARIKELIISGEFTPGSKLPREQDLAKQLGLSRNSLREAVRALTLVGVLDARDHGVLTEAYRFCERTRNRLFLLTNAPSDSLPQQPERLGRLARSLGMTPAELRDEYRRLTRRARVVVERRFYGRD